MRYDETEWMKREKRQSEISIFVVFLARIPMNVEKLSQNKNWIKKIFMWLKHDNNYKDLCETLLRSLYMCVKFCVALVFKQWKVVNIFNLDTQVLFVRQSSKIYRSFISSRMSLLLAIFYCSGVVRGFPFMLQ